MRRNVKHASAAPRTILFLLMSGDDPGLESDVPLAGHRKLGGIAQPLILARRVSRDGRGRRRPCQPDCYNQKATISMVMCEDACIIPLFRNIITESSLGRDKH